MKVGIVGFGFMGATHLNAWRKVDGIHVTAICERNLEGLSSKKGNIATDDTELDLEGVDLYRDLDAMLAEAELDAVSITLPTHLHKDISIQCLQAGLHVVCEKPMALHPEECQAMIDAARAAKKELLIAHCIRFWPAYAWLKQALEAGTYGELCTADFQRLSSAPSWGDNSWFTDPAKSGGIALDLHIHDLDFIHYLLGPTSKITSATVPFRDGNAGHIHSSLNYDNRVVTATASWLMPESFGFRMTYHVTFQKAAVTFDGEHLRVYPHESDVEEVQLPEGDGYQLEISYFADRMCGRATENIIPPEQAAESVRMALQTTQL